MAKTVTKTVEISDDDPENQQSEKMEDEDVIRALTELEGADEVRWQVHRISHPNPGFCPPELSTVELTMQRIASDYGAGRYKIKGVKANGQYYKSASVTIAASNKREETPIVVPPANDDNLFAMMMAMMQQNATVMAAAVARPQVEFPWASVLSASPALLLAAKELFKGKDNEDASMEKILKLVTIVEKLKGNDGEKGGTSWQDLIRDALPAVAGAFNRQPAPQMATQPLPTRVMAQSNGNPQIPATLTVDTPEAVEPTLEMLGFNWLKDKISELIGNAAANKNPELRAEVFCDDLPAYIPESLVIELLSADDWFTKLGGFDSRVNAYPAWFAELRENILLTLQPDGEDKNESAADA